MFDFLFTDWGLDRSLWPWLISTAIFISSLLLALILDLVIYPIILRFTRLTNIDLDGRLMRALRRPLALAIVLLGLYLAIVLPHTLSDSLRHLVNQGFSVLSVLLGVFATSSAAATIFQWYSQEISPRTESSLDDRLMPMLRRIVLALIYGLGLLLTLDILQVNISPLIAGLGLSGLAVALALQPTLANLFAGTYVMTEGVVHPGDYIELESGVAGYVIDVSWRSTRLRTWTNNLVVVPNSRFAETIITNYQGPAPAVNVYLTCGVSYDSDLARVEGICMEIMDDLLESDPRAVKEYGGFFGFESFDDSNVGFYLFIQARDRLASFEIQSELIKRTHQKFREEGIIINYPMRTVNLTDAQTTGAGGTTARRAPGPAEGRETAGEGPALSQRRQRNPGRERPASNVVGEGGGEAPGPDIG